MDHRLSIEAIAHRQSSSAAQLLAEGDEGVEVRTQSLIFFSSPLGVPLAPISVSRSDPSRRKRRRRRRRRRLSQRLAFASLYLLPQVETEVFVADRLGEESMSCLKTRVSILQSRQAHLDEVERWLVTMTARSAFPRHREKILISAAARALREYERT
ncbi:MAG: hypothetical protein WC483_02100 [Candidatus Paceibacterota bacterium]